MVFQGYTWESFTQLVKDRTTQFHEHWETADYLKGECPDSSCV